jgi:excisionase family DNA binding protein
MADDRGEADMSSKQAAEMVLNKVIVRRLLNVGETARYLGVKVDTVYKWSRMGVLSKVKLGGALRFDVNVLDRFIEQHSTKAIDY